MLSSRKTALIGALAILLGIGLGGLIEARGGGPLGIDVAWLDAMVSARTDAGLWLAHALNWVGGGWVAIYVVPLAVAGAFLLARRRWAALYVVVATILSAAAVQGLKWLFDRERPEDMLVISDHGSFPSGHVANAATLAVVIALVLRRTWVSVLAICYVIAMAISRTYLTVHWLSDTVAGALVGAGVALLVGVAFWSQLRPPAPAPQETT